MNSLFTLPLFIITAEATLASLNNSADTTDYVLVLDAYQ